jgi:hypothetical protein
VRSLVPSRNSAALSDRVTRPNTKSRDQGEDKMPVDGGCLMLLLGCVNVRTFLALPFPVPRGARGHASVDRSGVYPRNTLRDACHPVLGARTLP